MTDNPDIPLPVTYSTPRAGAVAHYVAARYAMLGPLECSLLQRGFNDSFEVRSNDGQRTVLRLSSWRARGEADVASEAAFLAYLDQSGIPVAAPVPATDGTLFGVAQLPEGQRPAVLFRFAEGRTPQWDSAADARANGVTLARIHRAANGYADRNAGRYQLDLDHLLSAIPTPDAPVPSFSRYPISRGRVCATRRDMFAACAGNLGLCESAAYIISAGAVLGAQADVGGAGICICPQSVTVSGLLAAASGRLSAVARVCRAASPFLPLP